MRLKKNYPKILLGLYILIWIIAAIAPKYRSVWIDENILPVLFVFLLIFIYKKFRFSNTSYTLIFIFLILHAIGGHYSYSEVPLFDLIKQQYGLSRNHYDRIVHFMFGVLFFLPFHEILTKIFKIPDGWRSLTITLFIVLSIKAGFEIIEYGYTAVRNNSLTVTNYLGEQGDPLDSIKDVALGFIGAIISLTITSIKRFLRR
ncbi:MAG: DUF2238 domain-containing protein [Nanoarchaeota archaeon]